jgi:RHS repeat-associated protein
LISDGGSFVARDAYSRPTLEQIGGSTGTAEITDIYDEHTGSLDEQNISRQAATSTTSGPVDGTAYAYDPSGNITQQTETRLGLSSDTETQCYQYNPLDQLTQAWSATAACSTAPGASNVGNTLGTGSAYWESWTFDSEGNRSGQTQYAIGAATTNTTTNYTYSSTQPNTLTSTSTTGGSTGSTSYSYDTAGNADKRTTPTDGTQTLAWDNAGQLSSVDTTAAGSANTAGTSSYVYDSSGNLLLQTTPTGTTLYFENEQATHSTSNGAVTGIRYLTLPGGGIVARTGNTTDYTFEITDQHGTAELDLDYTCQTPTWRQYDPYGNPRGTTATWVDNRTFLDKVTDPSTGLTDVGARWYDATLGRFISLDPALETTDPLALGGYAYTDGNPVTQEDPSGERFMTVARGGSDSSTSSGTASSNDGDDGTSSNWAWGVISGAGHAVEDFFSGGNKQTESDFDGINDLVHSAMVGDNVDQSSWNYGDGYLEGYASANLAPAAIGDPEADAGSLFDDPLVGCGESFTATTKVLTASGKTVLISALHDGDKLQAVNTATGKNEPQTVDAVMVNHDTDLYNLIVKTAEGLATVHTTSNHFFWDVTQRKWVNAAALRPGDRLRTANGTNAVVVGGTTPTVKTGWMWDLTVSNDHDFYVVAGSTPVLVHNYNCLPSPGTGPVTFRPPPNATASEIQQVKDYVDACEYARCTGQLSPTGRVPTAGTTLGRQANRAAAAERARAAAAGTPYSGVVGHAPDSTWNGVPTPPIWLDLSSRVNSSLAGQVNGYPVGYVPTQFLYSS